MRPAVGLFVEDVNKAARLHNGQSGVIGQNRARLRCRRRGEDDRLQSVDGSLIATVIELVVVGIAGFVATSFKELFELFVMQVAGDAAAPGID